MATTDEEVDEVLPTDEAPYVDAEGEDGLLSGPVVVGAVVVGLIAGAIGLWSLLNEERGTLSVHTEPPGARIELDGEAIDG
ncbi:MAG: hypothetical protein ABEN55_16930, partial [Bradymonadaceae bacterium]